MTKIYAKMRMALTLILAAGVSQVAAQTATAGTTATTTAVAIGPIGPNNVWRVPDTFIREAHLACDNAPPVKPGELPDFAACFIAQMSKFEAPPDAVQFTRDYRLLSHGELAIITDFKKAGAVDMVNVLYPLRANENTGFLLVNGDPRILDVNDMKYLDRKAMEESWTYKVIKERYPQADIWPTSMPKGQWPLVNSLPDGGVGFVFGYPVINGCHACLHVGLERFEWDFDSHGKFLHTTYMFSPPPPRHHMPGTNPPEAEAPQSQPQGTAPASQPQH